MGCKVSGFEGVEKLFDDLVANTDRMTLEAVNAAAPYLVESAEKAVKSAAHKGYATGGLAKSFTATKAKKNQYGTYAVVKPVGKDDKGVSYGARAAYLEYGTTVNGKLHNESAPWRQKAVNNAKEKCQKAMEESIYKELDKIGG